VSVRERIAAIQGTMKIRSAIGNGTLAVISVTVQELDSVPLEAL
jgi:hypothetical protein